MPDITTDSPSKSLAPRTVLIFGNPATGAGAGFKSPVSSSAVQQNLSSFIDGCHDIFTSVVMKPINGFTVNELEIAVEIGVDGSVGFASVNTKGTVTLKFSKNH